MGEQAARRRGRSSSGWRFARDLLIILLAALLASFLVKTFLIRSFYIPSGSMKDTLQINDRVIVNELATLHRGYQILSDPNV